MIEAWEASCNSDTVEGRGYKVVIGFFKTKKDADRAAEHRGPMGVSNGDVQRVQIFESWEEFQAHQTRQARKSALRKLTQEEQIALLGKVEWDEDE